MMSTKQNYYILEGDKITGKLIFITRCNTRDILEIDFSYAVVTIRDSKIVKVVHYTPKNPDGVEISVKKFAGLWAYAKSDNFDKFDSFFRTYVETTPFRFNKKVIGFLYDENGFYFYKDNNIKRINNHETVKSLSEKIQEL